MRTMALALSPDWSVRGRVSTSGVHASGDISAYATAKFWVRRYLFYGSWRHSSPQSEGAGSMRENDSHNGARECGAVIFAGGRIRHGMGLGTCPRGGRRGPRQVLARPQGRRARGGARGLDRRPERGRGELRHRRAGAAAARLRAGPRRGGGGAGVQLRGLGVPGGAGRRPPRSWRGSAGWSAASSPSTSWSSPNSRSPRPARSAARPWPGWPPTPEHSCDDLRL
jgi:hypothetical protein